MTKFFVVTYFVIFLIGLFGLGYMHEMVHVEIMKNYGINSHIEYFSHFPDLVTISDEPCPSEECLQSHAINEAIGYHLNIFYCVFGFGLFVLIVVIDIWFQEIYKTAKSVEKVWDVEDANK